MRERPVREAEIQETGMQEMQEVTLRFGVQQRNDYRTKEAYKTLRTNIEFSGPDIRVIAVTSCTPNEGMTCSWCAAPHATARPMPCIRPGIR